MIPLSPGALDEARVREHAARFGITLDAKEQLEFLASARSIDLQAAPGSGKTTLVALKLCLIADSWESTAQGVCVLSHTNTAKDQIIERLRQSGSATPLLHYPHFIGTIQSFADTFLALPYLRSRGIDVHSLDDDAYADAARRALERNPKYRTLKAHLENSYNGMELVENACFSFNGNDFTIPAANKLQAGPATNSGKQFVALKWDLAKRGYFRYGDMYAIAHRYLHQHPSISKAIAIRFPYVLVDEMQDTNGQQQEMLSKLFGTGVVIQRAGDINQSIYEGSTGSFPRTDAIDLPHSQRFGPAIARVATATAVNRPQHIVGNGPASSLIILTFDASTIAAVVPAFQRLANDRLAPDALASGPPRIVGARKRPGASAAFPQSIACYVPGFTSDIDKPSNLNLIEAVRAAQELWAAGDAAVAAATLWDTTCRALTTSGYEIGGIKPTSRRLKLFLEGNEPELYEVLRQFYVRAIKDKNAASEGIWAATASDFTQIITAICGSSPDLAGFLAYSNNQSTGAQEQPMTPEMSVGQVTTTQAAKGETHPATMILECFLRGKHDVSEVLKLLAAGQPITHKTPKTIRQAAQLFFVAATRPRHMLAVAAMHEHIAAQLDDLQAMGWEVIEAGTVVPISGATTVALQ